MSFPSANINCVRAANSIHFMHHNLKHVYLEVSLGYQLTEAMSGCVCMSFCLCPLSILKIFLNSLGVISSNCSPIQEGWLAPLLIRSHDSEGLVFFPAAQNWGLTTLLQGIYLACLQSRSTPADGHMSLLRPFTLM